MCLAILLHEASERYSLDLMLLDLQVFSIVSSNASTNTENKNSRQFKSLDHPILQQQTLDFREHLLFLHQ